jgi:hypothetical protein
MSTYTWIFLETGRVKKKLTFVLCSPSGTGHIERDRISDLNVAYQYEKEAIKSGHHTFTNHIDDFLSGSKQGSTKGIRRMQQPEFTEFLRGK